MEQAVQQPAVPRMPLGMLEEPLRRLLHRGRKPPPEKRAVGDLERVPSGQRRKKRSGSRATRSRSLPLFRSNQRQSAGRVPASVVLPHCRGPRVRCRETPRDTRQKGLTGSFQALLNEIRCFEMQGIRSVVDPARQPLSACFPAWNRKWRRTPSIEAGPPTAAGLCRVVQGLGALTPAAHAGIKQASYESNHGPQHSRGS